MRFRIRRTSSKVLMIIAILIFCVFIKIGYAYLSQDLAMSGLTVAAKNTWDVHFADNSIVEKENLDECSGGITCSRITQHAAIGQDGVSVNFGVEFHVIGDYYEFTVDVVNNGTIDAMLNEIVKEGLTGNSEYLDFTVTYSDGTPIAQYDQLLKNGGTETLKVTVTYIGTPIEDVNANLGLTVNYIQADDSVQSRSYEPETMIRSLNTLGTSIADDDPDGNLRFIGANPDNYVWFNNQKWRIIGVFDGRLKIIQESIGNYSWNSSKENDGWGSNQWGPNNSGYTGAAIMKLLNPGYETNTDLKCKTKVTWEMTSIECNNNKASDYSSGLVNNSLYWNATSGKCYTFGNHNTEDCDFTSTGLRDIKSKNMIDNVTWHLGTNSAETDPYSNEAANASFLYNSERSNNTGKQCDEANDPYDLCNDMVDRTTMWQGKVGLMYPSDYVYATGGGNTYSRSDCLGFYIGSNFSGWRNTYTECSANDWLKPNEKTWTISPKGDSSKAVCTYTVYDIGYVNGTGAAQPYAVRPVVYLKRGVSFTNEGDGTQARPYVLRDLSNTTTVTFNANGGTLVSTTRQITGGSSIGVLPTPTAPANKIFDGWYTELTNGSKVSSSYIPTADVILYAHWIQLYDPETRIRSLNTIGTSIADDDPDGNLRFIGANPKNYVSFNNQTWRIIGVFDGKLKIVQDSIGNYSWDTSKNNVNRGFGINQWGPSGTYDGADLLKLLNPGYENNTDTKCNKKTELNYNTLNIDCGNNSASNYSTGLVNNSLYWTASSGKCYTYGNYNVVDCDFTSTGLNDSISRNMIEDATWYLGTYDITDNLNSNGGLTGTVLYNSERSNNSSKQCNSGNNCNDSVVRTLSWQGKVGLMYASDYAYATGGGNTYSRSDCLGFYIGNNDKISGWGNRYNECIANDWLNEENEIMWMLTSAPGSITDYANGYIVLSKMEEGNFSNSSAMVANSVRPVVYLKSNVKFTDKGNGKKTNPFVLKLID